MRPDRYAARVGEEIGSPVGAGVVRARAGRVGPWWWGALGVHLGWLPVALWVPVEPGFVGPVAWVLLPAGVALFRVWWRMAELDTWWVVRRRGVTVRARFEADPGSESVTAYVVRFRTLEGREVTAYGQSGGRRDVIRYDPRDPARVLAPSPWARFGIAVAAFTLPGFAGVVLSAPAVYWLFGLVRLLTVPR